MDNKFIKSLYDKLSKVDLDSTYYSFSKVTIPIPNALIDENDILYSEVTDEEVKKDAIAFIKFSGKVDRKKQLNIPVELTPLSVPPNTNITEVTYTIYKDSDIEKLLDIMENIFN